MAVNILSVDIGTSSLKAAIIDSDGCLLAFSRNAYPFLPQQYSGEFTGQGSCGADAWEDAFYLALEDLCRKSPDCAIDAVCISGNGPTLVPVTAGGRTLAPLYWHGQTSLGGPEFNSSNRAAQSFFLPHAAWFKRNSPEAYKETSLFLSSHEWLAKRLGADAFAVLPNEAYKPYYWDDDQCRYFNLEKGKFPPFTVSGKKMGEVSAAAAARYMGDCRNLLKSGIPIIAGGPDFITALIGTGTMCPSEVCDRAGSSEGINVCTSSPPKGGSLRVLPHAMEGLWNVGAVIQSSGSLFERFRAITGQSRRPYEEHLAELIPLADDPDIFGAVLNSSFPFLQPDADIPHSPLDQGRSVLCAIGFAVRRAIETLNARGMNVKEMRVSGGQGKNTLWNQLKSDIADVTLKVPEICDGELAGNAILAAVALGCASCPEKAAAGMIRFRKVYRPRPEAASFWKESYLSWKGRA